MSVNSTNVVLNFFTQYSPAKTIGALLGTALVVFGIYWKWKNSSVPEQIFKEPSLSLKVISEVTHLEIQLKGDLEALSDKFRETIAKAIDSWYKLQQRKLSHDLPAVTMHDVKEKYFILIFPMDVCELSCMLSFDPSHYTLCIKGTDCDVMRLYRNHADNFIKECRHDLKISQSYFI